MCGTAGAQTRRAIPGAGRSTDESTTLSMSRDHVDPERYSCAGSSEPSCSRLRWNYNNLLLAYCGATLWILLSACSFILLCCANTKRG